MNDVKADVQTLLNANPALVALLGAKHVYIDTTKNKDQYPRIVLFEIDISDADYADDDPMAYQPIIQASIFSKERTLAIFREVDRSMKAAGWRRIANNEVYEEDRQIYHRPLRYRNKLLYE